MISSQVKFSTEGLTIRVKKKIDLDDMTLTSWVLSKAICIPNMRTVT